jgi:CheY-like chemotaxis protein
MLKMFKFEKTDHAKILVVDDEPDLIATIACRLEANGYGVLTAANGEEALERVVADKPDLILLDNSMPVMTGLEVLQRLRTSPKLQDIPVIMCTALCEPTDISEAQSCGIADYVTKPFDCAELIQKIENALMTRSKT